ncbi:MAG: ComEC/Rec2 family competence protein [Bdellovibrionales bacterium]|nr:ComEC/Rec2 family competence protein [Bdellovibrionales bacterium]
MTTIQDFVLHQGVELCRAAIPNTLYAPLYGALVCGIDVPSGRDKALFLDSGLIHILVVSGAHLVFIEQLCAWLPERTRTPVLVFYSWLTGFGAPVVRALVRRLCAKRVTGWGWSAVQIELLTSVVILLIVPSWLLSRSFLMSWLCALAIQAPGRWPRHPQLTLSMKCYLFLFPFCLTSPLTVAWNCVLAPVIASLLFPVCLLAFIHPLFASVGDVFWSVLLWILEAGPRTEPATTFINTRALCWLPLTVHLLLLIGELKWRRAVAFSSL